MDLQSTPEQLLMSKPADENLSSSSSHDPVVVVPRPEGILRNIEQILMEDEVEPHAMVLESWELRAKERSLYEALGQKYPPSPSPQREPTTFLDQHVHEKDNYNSVAIIKEFDDNEWMYTVDGRDDKLAASIAKMQLVGLKTTQKQGGGPKLQAGSSKKKRSSNNNDDENNVADLRGLLTDCAKSVSVGDCPTAHSLLTKIRQHSSPCGDALQRLAHYLADGMEARLAGTGRFQPHDVSDMTEASSHYWRVYRNFDVSCLFRKISSFACNETILERSKTATTIHVIDFGILYGFQWPSFIRRVAGRGQAIKLLRITGVDFPRVAGIVEDTGRRLASYADKLGVPFEFKAIAREWETIGIEDLQIDKGGGEYFVAVVGSVRSVELLNEPLFGEEDCPRDVVLQLIRQVKPDIFIHGILNGSHSQPYFLYRFRELMLQFMSVFDMLDMLEPRDKPERMMVERELLGKVIVNVIACEGPERVERPETHRQWQVRLVRAGFASVSFRKNLTDAMICKVNEFYHTNFSICQERHWLLMSWKGRVLNAISCWQPAV